MESQRLEPYRSTPIFDETSLPAGLRREHRTKAGVWGLIRVLEGELIYTILEPRHDQRVTPETPAVILPEQPHFVTPVGKIRVQVEFYDREPDVGRPHP